MSLKESEAAGWSEHRKQKAGRCSEARGAREQVLGGSASSAEELVLHPEYSCHWRVADGSGTIQSLSSSFWFGTEGISRGARENAVSQMR